MTDYATQQKFAARISRIMIDRMPALDIARASIVQDQERGIREVTTLLREATDDAKRAVGMGSLLISWLDNRRPVTEELTHLYNELDSIEPGIEMARASIRLSKLTGHIIERITLCISLHPELFDINNLRESIVTIAKEE